MKRLLCCSMAVLALSGIRAEAAYTYGICTDNLSGVGLGQAGTNYSAAIRVPEEMAKAMEGAKLTAVSIGFGSGLSKDATIYLTYDLDGEPFYTQTESKFLVTRSFSDAQLATPYEIEGREFYIGYTYRQTRSSDKPIAFDGEDLGNSGMFSYLATWSDNGTPEWNSYPEHGALSIRAEIEGVGELSGAVLPLGISLPKSVSIGSEFDYTLDVVNESTVPVEKLTLSSAFGSGQPVQTTVTLDRALAPGARGSVGLRGRVDEDNPDLPVEVTVTKVDGMDNLLSSWPATATVIASDFMHQRVVVIEEGTGIGCGWCVAGYVALEQMREKYPDTYMGIAVHNYPNDPMRCASYAQWEDYYGGGYPYATISRSNQYGKFSPQPATCEGFYNSLAGMVNLDLRVSAELAGADGKTLLVRTTARFGEDIDSHNYGIAIVQTEDNVGPYYQSNYFSGGSNGEMYGFENQSGYVSLIYNDVARRIDNWEGKDVFPASLSFGEKYVYEEEVPVGSEWQKLEDTRVAVLLIDRDTREIVTAARCRIGQTSAVDGAVVTEPVVRTAEGGIIVEGSFDRVEAFRLDGVCAGVAERSGMLALDKGVYIVCVTDAGRVYVSKHIVR